MDQSPRNCFYIHCLVSVNVKQEGINGNECIFLHIEKLNDMYLLSSQTSFCWTATPLLSGKKPNICVIVREIQLVFSIFDKYPPLSFTPKLFSFFFPSFVVTPFFLLTIIINIYNFFLISCIHQNKHLMRDNIKRKHCFLSKGFTSSVSLCGQIVFCCEKLSQ